MPTDIRSHISKHLGALASLPFLFVGSGLSRRYLDLPSWRGLLEHFSSGLPHPFVYYYSKADGHLPTTAGFMADDFHELWWSHPSYARSRAQFGDLAHEKAACLKYEVSEYLNRLQERPSRRPARHTEELELLRQSTIDGIITTNWDTLLEAVFPKYHVFVGQSALISSTPQQIAEIYRIHGCVTCPASLVLTQSDYENFNARNPYLAAKLTTLFVEHPILFVGYSLSDENITELLRQIISALSDQDVYKLRDHLIFVTRDDENRGDGFESTTMQIGQQLLPVTIVRTNDFRKVFQPLYLTRLIIERR